MIHRYKHTCMCIYIMVAEKGHAAAAWAEAKKLMRPIKSRRGLLLAAAAYYKADAAFCGPLRPMQSQSSLAKSRFGLTISQSGLLELLYYNIHFYYQQSAHLQESGFW